MPDSFLIRAAQHFLGLLRHLCDTDLATDHIEMNCTRASRELRKGTLRLDEMRIFSFLVALASHSVHRPSFWLTHDCLLACRKQMMMQV